MNYMNQDTAVLRSSCEPFDRVHPLSHPPQKNRQQQADHPYPTFSLEMTSNMVDFNQGNFRYGGLSGAPVFSAAMMSPYPPRHCSFSTPDTFAPPPRPPPSQSLPTTPVQYHHTPFMSPIITTTRSHSIKRNSKRSSTYSRWTFEEDELLRQAVALHGPHKWSLIASHVPNRTPMQCSTRWLGALNPNIHKGRWTEYEDSILRYSVLEYASLIDHEGQVQPIPWNKIAERIPNRTGIQCQARWTEALDPYVRKGKWSADEDALLRAGVEEFGRCWIRIADTIPGRTQRQCRTRWMQIKYKENRQQRCDTPVSRACQRRNSSVDDASSVSCTSTEEDRYSIDYAAAAAVAVAASAASAPMSSMPISAPAATMMPYPSPSIHTPTYHGDNMMTPFVVDGYDNQLINASNSPIFHQHIHSHCHPSVFKEEDVNALSFLTQLTSNWEGPQ